MDVPEADFDSRDLRVDYDGYAQMVGEGRAGMVLRFESHPDGYVYKFPRVTDGTEVDALFMERGRHAVLRELGMNTLASYDVVVWTNPDSPDGDRRYVGRMPDLTEGGRRYVFSVQDAFRYQNEYGVPFPVDSSGPKGRVDNGDAFFAELARQMGLAAGARLNVNGAPIDGIKLEVPGMFMVAEQVRPGEVRLETVIADFHDGQTFGTNGRPEPEFNLARPEYYQVVGSYLTWVTRFYPDLTDQADAFLRELSQGMCPLNG